jgi:hypothetical protein
VDYDHPERKPRKALIHQGTPQTTLSSARNLLYMLLFSDERELLDFAEKMLRDRIDSLENDVDRCLTSKPNLGRPAPFPALLYCFSTIDLLGTIYEGNATRRAPTSDQSKNYMTRLMRYPESEARDTSDEGLDQSDS